MRIVCWQTILMNYHTLFFRNLGYMLKKMSSAAVVIGPLRVKRVEEKIYNAMLAEHFISVSQRV